MGVVLIGEVLKGVAVMGVVLIGSALKGAAVLGVLGATTARLDRGTMGVPRSQHPVLRVAMGALAERESEAPPRPALDMLVLMALTPTPELVVAGCQQAA